MQTKAGGTPRRKLVAIVDDDALIRETLHDLLDSAGHASATFASAQGLLRSRRLGSFACLITDMRMPRTSGIDLHLRLLAAGIDIPTILMTAYPDDAVRQRATSAGILCYLPKPFTTEALLACVDKALRRDAGRGHG